MEHQLGDTLLIANPVAQSGSGLAAANYASEVLQGALQGKGFKCIMTESPGHGKDIASSAQAYDTVIALGGDGIIHEVANGLMAIPEASRPAMGVLPVGTGNDYARTVRMDFRIEHSVAQLLTCRKESFDLGICNGEYFVETISFGLDAAIALDTVSRRERTGKTGTALFLASGMDMLLHNLRTYEYEASLDEAACEKGRMILFAVQIGRTYGGGFDICPDADTSDGLLDLCIAHPPLGIPKAVTIFLLAKNGHHTGFKQLEFKQARSLSLKFLGPRPPVQVDGESFPAESYDIRCVEAALEVLVPPE